MLSLYTRLLDKAWSLPPLLLFNKGSVSEAFMGGIILWTSDRELSEYIRHLHFQKLKHFRGKILQQKIFYPTLLDCSTAQASPRPMTVFKIRLIILQHGYSASILRGHSVL
uniref:Uncharacterized protein n=1 Tax=Podarcis muralis TaxID=64176 RepID=A0A670HZI8_PODMU